jgi:hypothetical protein
MLLSVPRGEWFRTVRANVEGPKDPLGIGQGADDLAAGRRPFPHERRDGNDLVGLSELGILRQIDDLDVVKAGEVFFAELFDIAKGGERFGSRPGNVES